MKPEMRRTLAAVAERILPADEWPGATEAHVIDYMEWLDAQASVAHRRPVLSRGVELLESLARAMFDRAFAECDPERQDAVLSRLQSIPHPTPQRFFAMLVNMTLAGYFCDPKYGGNRDGVVWRHMRFEPDPAS